MKKSGSESADEIAKKSAPEFFVRSLKSNSKSRVDFVPDPRSLDRFRRFGNDYLSRSLRSSGHGEYLARAMRGAGNILVIGFFKKYDLLKVIKKHLF